MNRPLTKDEIDALPVADRLRLMEDIWTSLDACANEQSVPDWQVRILEDRLDAHRRDPDAARPWHEVEALVRDVLRK